MSTTTFPDVAIIASHEMKRAGLDTYTVQIIRMGGSVFRRSFYKDYDPSVQDLTVHQLRQELLSWGYDPAEAEEAVRAIFPKHFCGPAR